MHRHQPDRRAPSIRLRLAVAVGFPCSKAGTILSTFLWDKRQPPGTDCEQIRGEHSPIEKPVDCGEMTLDSSSSYAAPGKFKAGDSPIVSLPREKGLSRHPDNEKKCPHPTPTELAVNLHTPCERLELYLVFEQRDKKKQQVMSSFKMQHRYRFYFHSVDKGDRRSYFPAPRRLKSGWRRRNVYLLLHDKLKQEATNEGVSFHA